MTFPFSPNPGPKVYLLTIDEIKVLYELFKDEYVAYDNEEAHKLIRKLRVLVDEHELATRDSKST